MPSRDNSRYSLMQVVDGPAFQQRISTRIPRKRPHAKFAHAHAVDGPSILPEGTLESAPQTRERGDPSGPVRSGCLRGRRNSKKRFGLSDPAVWNAIQKAMAQQNRLSSLVPHDTSPRKAGVFHRPSVPSRTSSRRKALNHFSKELGKYANAACAAGRLPVITPTESDEKASLHTLKPLIPYIQEFETAGFAVTSEQQRRWSPQKSDDQQHRESIDLDRHSWPNPHKENLDGQYETSVSSPSSNSGSIVEFTPPQKMHTTWAEPISVKKQSPPPLPPPKDTRPTGRMRLPWLRKRAPATNDKLPPRQRVGTMVETKKGEWRIANEDFNSKRKGPVDAPSKQARRESVNTTKRETPHDLAPPRTPAQLRASVKRSHVAGYVREVPSNQEEQHTHITWPDPEPRFRTERELAQVSLPRPPRARKKTDNTARHHHHPFFQHNHHSSFHHLHHVHGAPVVLEAQNSEKSPTRNLQKPLPEMKYPERRATSPVPKLPYTWKYAVSNASSLERALDTAQTRVESTKLQAANPPPLVADVRGAARSVKQSNRQQRHGHKHHPLLAKAACADRQVREYPQVPAEPALTKEYVKTGTTFGGNIAELKHVKSNISVQDEVKTKQNPEYFIRPPIQDRSPLASKEDVENTNAQTELTSLQSFVGANGQPAVLLKENDGKQSQDAVEANLQNGSTFPTGKPMATVEKSPSNLEAALEDLDVFFDTDDAAIDDRDVLRGLQVAVKAAADDMYDALIRHRTGLRIRRFLADLKSIDAIDAELGVNQPPRQWRAEKRRAGTLGHR